MAIDDKFDALDKAYPEKQPYLPQDLATFAAECFLPEKLTEALGVVLDRSSRKSQEERARETFKLVIHELREIKKETVNKKDLSDLKEAMQLAIRHDVEQFNNKKRERYLKILGGALRTDKQVDDIASYVQDVERLGEKDFAALKVLNKVMNKPSDWNTTVGGSLHPGLFVQRRTELATEMAGAFGQDVSKPQFSREEGYDACNRLQAFGLAHEIETAPRQVPIGDYSFRPSIRGLTLLHLVGVEVPNLDKYTSPPQTR